MEKSINPRKFANDVYKSLVENLTDGTESKEDLEKIRMQISNVMNTVNKVEDATLCIGVSGENDLGVFNNASVSYKL